MSTTIRPAATAVLLIVLAILTVARLRLPYTASALSSLGKTMHARQDSNSGEAQCSINIPGYRNHGDCSLLCHDTSWVDILTFYAGNYGAHVATILSTPGQGALATALNLMIALLYPGSGVMRGVAAIFSLAKFGKTDLQVAARAGAICAVVKFKDEEQENEQPLTAEAAELGAMQQPDSPAALEMGGTLLGPLKQRNGKSAWVTYTQSSRLMSVNIHGTWNLPQGYKMAIVPPLSKFEDDDADVDDSDTMPSASRDTESAKRRRPWPRRLGAAVLAIFRKTDFPEWSASRHKPVTLSRNYNLVKGLVSIWQILYALTTLYEARGNQIGMYGYAAFGLTVAPYAWMSLINLVGSCICPQYDAFYVVESVGLDDLRKEVEARKAHADASLSSATYFGVEGTVGRLTAESDAALQDIMAKAPRDEHPEVASGIVNCHHSYKQVRILCCISICASLVPLAIVGGLSQFRQGQSTAAQRVWTMLWHVMGITVGCTVGMPETSPAGEPLDYERDDESVTIIVLGLAFYGVAAVGGYVVAGQMLNDFGVCSKLKNVI